MVIGICIFCAGLLIGILIGMFIGYSGGVDEGERKGRIEQLKSIGGGNDRRN